MTRYFFNVHDHSGVATDEEGQDLRNLHAARAVAIEGARSLMAEDVFNGLIRLGDYIEVTDSGGTILITLRFSEAVEIVP